MRGEQIRQRSQLRRIAYRSSLAVAIAASVAASAAGQMTFSIDYQGPPIGAPDSCTGVVGLTEGDILAAFTITPAPGPIPSPCIFYPGGPGGLGLPLYPPAVGHPPGVAGFVEVDALSYGFEPRIQRGGPQIYTWHFSVDEFAIGTGITPPPNVFSEGAAGAREAAADIFTYASRSFGPVCGPPLFSGNTALIDGDGIPPFGGPGLGLIEPIPPLPGVPDGGTNLDALDMDTLPALPGMPVYFSLDSGIFDPAEGVPNTLSALANGVGVGGDVLITPAPGAFPIVFAPAPMLGLDIFGPDTDDIDALILWENGTGAFEPAMMPYDWLFGRDMLMFSVRRGSAVIGAPDSLCGLPIEPGDILVPPAAAGGFPGIWIPAEALGLATVRAGFPNSDDLNALDVLCSIQGDVDGDGDVDLTDLAVLLSNFGCVGVCPGDVDGDGDVDLTDLAILLSSFGATC